MANALAMLRVLEREGGISFRDKADAAAGHSLGEYSALCAAGAFDVPTTARLLKLRGKAMQAAVPVGEGAMAALLGATIEKAEALASEAAQGEICTVANDNDPGQVVISGHVGAIERAVAMVRDDKARWGIKRGVLLPVSAPFHCPLMAPAAEAMAQALAQTSSPGAFLPIYANVTAAPASDAETIRRLLVEQVTGRVRWRESIAAMVAAGITEFVELGGKVLTPMVKRIAPDAAAISVIGMDDIEALAARI
jgi:[acyl-carrier-protein] S-malonyltransferase